LPPLPPILSSETKSQIYTHRSLHGRPSSRFEDPEHDPSPDNERFEHLGDQVLGLIVTELIQEMYPRVRVGPATKMRALVVSNNNLASIAMKYKMPNSLRLHRAQMLTLRASAHVQADLFEAFIGGLYTEQGLDIVRTWLSDLLRPYVQASYQRVRESHGLSRNVAPLPPPQMSSTSSDDSHIPGKGLHDATTSSTTGYLSLFNQIVSRRGTNVEWKFHDASSQSSASEGGGSKTTPMWLVRLYVDNELYGTGVGTTKKVAKNMAAKAGLRHM
ncbi:ribonuclease III, partial [Fistulina hepatica ATCC 64428]